MASLIKEMNEGKADWQIITYAYSKHTFTDPKSPDYNEAMAKKGVGTYLTIFERSTAIITIANSSIQVFKYYLPLALNTVISFFTSSS